MIGIGGEFLYLKIGVVCVSGCSLLLNMWDGKTRCCYRISGSLWGGGGDGGCDGGSGGGGGGGGSEGGCEGDGGGSEGGGCGDDGGDIYYYIYLNLIYIYNNLDPSIFSFKVWENWYKPGYIYNILFAFTEDKIHNYIIWII